MSEIAQRATMESFQSNDEPWELPPSWCWRRLGEVSEILDNLRRPLNRTERAARNKERPNSELIPYYGATGRAGWIDDYLLDGDYILLGEDGAPFLDRSASKAYAISGKAWVNNHAHILKEASGIDARFLLHALNNTDYSRWVNGTTRLKLTQAAMREIPVPCPPIDVQKQIGCRVDKLFAEIEEGESALTDVRAGLDTYRKSLLNTAVTGNLTTDWRTSNHDLTSGSDLLRSILLERTRERTRAASGRTDRHDDPNDVNLSNLPELPAGWTWATLRQLTATLRNGVSKRPDADQGGVPILRISAVRPLQVDAKQLRWLSSNFDAEGYWVRAGDFLVTRYNGSPELVGVCGRYRALEPVVHPDKLIRLVPASKSEDVNDFIEIALNVGASRKFISENTKTTAGQHGVSGETVGLTPIPLPPLRELSEIIRRVRIGLGGFRILVDQLDTSSSPASLRQSILAAAFRGELVR